jgi:dsRNA-specific ribonuclease
MLTMSGGTLKSSRDLELSEALAGYNPSNQLLTRQFVEQTLSRLCGYTVRIGSLDKYQLAFVHKSVYRKDIAPPPQVISDYLKQTSQNSVPLNPPPPIGTFRRFDETSTKSHPLIFTDTYEAMEFVGDGWVNAVVGQYVKRRFPCQSEGFYSKMKSHVICKDGLSKISRHLGFGAYALLSPEAEQLLTRNNPSLLEDMFEAFCDAVFEDQGIGMLQTIMKNLIECVIDFRAVIINDSNYKDVFKRSCKELGWSHPKYIDLGDNGLIGAKREYSVGIELIPEAIERGIRGRTTFDQSNKEIECMALGSGITKKKAQQAAALNALRHLETAAKDRSSTLY